ncbi:hypothetical protein [Lacticaseibacillus nasuensis]|uniref:hypothetical protein n=1 Tax=Lacticaseibacillus nasuensis TaxID=944671 RepID=UPI002246B123|nr:hypothetical protein [Lacticaseibacillus nasuensis]MCX2455671.1 hypothetical protein [Lacticaseibacillus nasuensis]
MRFLDVDDDELATVFAELAFAFDELDFDELDDFLAAELLDDVFFFNDDAACFVSSLGAG